MNTWIWAVKGYHTPSADMFSAQREPWIFTVKQTNKR